MTNPEQLPVFYVIRFERNGKWVGKKSPTYAISTAKHPDTSLDDAFWWAQSPKAARVWSSAESLRKFRNLCSRLSAYFDKFIVEGTDGYQTKLDVF